MSAPAGPGGHQPVKDQAAGQAPARLVGADAWDEALYEHLTTHVQVERGLLQDYVKAAGESGSIAFQYLVDLIVEDEKRHHKRFSELAATLRTDAEFRTEEPAVPRLDGWGEHPDEVMEQTDRLLERERADAKELRRLEKQLRVVKDTTLWQLLVKLMEIDTQKHVAILEFVKDHPGR